MPINWSQLGTTLSGTPPRPPFKSMFFSLRCCTQASKLRAKQQTLNISSFESKFYSLTLSLIGLSILKSVYDLWILQFLLSSCPNVAPSSSTCLTISLRSVLVPNFLFREMILKYSFASYVLSALSSSGHIFSAIVMRIKLPVLLGDIFDSLQMFFVNNQRAEFLRCPTKCIDHYMGQPILV